MKDVRASTVASDGLNILSANPYRFPQTEDQTNALIIHIPQNWKCVQSIMVHEVYPFKTVRLVPRHLPLGGAYPASYSSTIPNSSLSCAQQQQQSQIPTPYTTRSHNVSNTHLSPRRHLLRHNQEILHRRQSRLSSE